MPGVDFELSDDQVALRDAAASLLDARCPMSRVREISTTENRFDSELWASMANQGWLGIELPEEQGGLGLGMVETVVLCEQLGCRLAPVPFLGTVLAQRALTDALATGALDDDRVIGSLSAREWVERLARGEARGALAWSGRDDRVVATRGLANGDDSWTLTGRSDLVVYAPIADLVVVFGRRPEGRALFALAPTGKDRPSAEPAMDLTRSVAWFDLHGERAHAIGDEAAADALLDRAVTAVCAEMLGASTRALEITVQYAKDRVQFGRPIGSFQAVKHRCADMLVDLEGMRSSTYYAGWAVGALDLEAPSGASAAKIWCSDAAARIMGSALQVHGGIGFTWEHDLHLYLKRSQLDQVSFGDAVAHRERLAKILRPRAEEGRPIL
jgi:alkylation response protein AidB-like acyl-CoA dehydrogenase